MEIEVLCYLHEVLEDTRIRQDCNQAFTISATLVLDGEPSGIADVDGDVGDTLGALGIVGDVGVGRETPVRRAPRHGHDPRGIDRGDTEAWVAVPREEQRQIMSWAMRLWAREQTEVCRIGIAKVAPDGTELSHVVMDP